MNHDFAIVFETMLASVAEEAASKAIRQFGIDEQRRQQDLAGERLLLRSHEAAEQLAISPATLQRLTSSGELPCVRIGSSVRYSNETLLDWIRQKEFVSVDDQPVKPPKKVSRSIAPATAVPQAGVIEATKNIPQQKNQGL
jgi:excisionase family DNA binding protein